jgi:uncharacterized protein YbaR (Trm112 family)
VQAVTEAETLLEILDCPLCRKGGGLTPQRDGRAPFLACPECEHWYPIQDGVVVLLPPHENPGALRRKLGPACEFELRRGKLGALDLKAANYSYYARLYELEQLSGLHRHPVVVDVGCSTGSLAATLLPEQLYIGFDMSIRSLAFARRATGQFFVQADAQALPLRSQAVSFFVSQHQFDPQQNGNRVAPRKHAKQTYAKKRRGKNQIPG